MKDHLRLLPSPSFQLSAIPHSLTPNLAEHIVHQLQTVLHNDFLQCINTKPSPGSALQLGLTAWPFLRSLQMTLHTQAIFLVPEVLFVVRLPFSSDSLFAFHMLRAHQEESHEGPLTIKSRGR